MKPKKQEQDLKTNALSKTNSTKPQAASVEPQLVNNSQKNTKTVIDYEHLNDLARLPRLNEEELLAAMEARYKMNKIFSYVGPTLSVMNPFKSIAEEFSNLKQEEFEESVLNGIDPYSLSPHIYGVAASAILKASESSNKQAIVISGESGAGKTENTKYALQFLTQLQEKNNEVQEEMANSSVLRGSWSRVSYRRTLTIEQRILACNPILESFGNAKTTRNDNSSRFGKLTKLKLRTAPQNHLDQKKRESQNKVNLMVITGGSMSSYLLEKSRIVKVSNEERNYHAFYQLLAGEDTQILQQLGLPWKTPAAFRYLRSQVESIKGVNDQEQYNEVIKSFDELGFTEVEKQSVQEILVTILLLGNIDFEEKEDNLPPTILRSQRILSTSICKRLQCTEENLLLALATKKRLVGNSQTISPLTIPECNSNRDSLSKYLYDSLFSWLVNKLNSFISPEEKLLSGNLSAEPGQTETKTNIIEILDIFGFEHFAQNGFEQLCINFANEKLQQLYISYIYKGEIHLFEEQDLSNFLSELQFSDNQNILTALENGREPIGVFNLIDESSSIQQSDDTALLSSIKRQHQNSKVIHFSVQQQKSFTVKHSIGSVQYQIMGFREKNKDEVSIQLQQLTQNKGIKCILLQEEVKPIIAPNSFSQQKPNPSTNQVKNTKNQEKFIGAKFRLQMNKLMEELKSCECQFVRCIKPNTFKTPKEFDKSYVLNQINCLGLLETIRVRKEGYLYRAEYDKFIQQFKLILKSSKQKEVDEKEFRESQQVTTKELLQKNKVGSDGILFGRSMIFIKEKKLMDLQESLKQKTKVLKEAALKISRAYQAHKICLWLDKIKKVKRFLLRLVYKYRFEKSDVISKLREARKEKERQGKLQKCMNQIGKCVQIYKLKKRLKRMCAARKIQLWFIDQKRKEFYKNKLKVVKEYIKNKFKMIFQRKIYKKIKQGIIKIQKLFRRYKIKQIMLKYMASQKVIKDSLIRAWKIIENKAATKINSLVRMYLAKCRNFKIVLQARQVGQKEKRKRKAIMIEKAWRKYLFRNQLKVYRFAAVKIQKNWRRKACSKKFKTIQNSILIIQNHVIINYSFNLLSH